MNAFIADSLKGQPDAAPLMDGYQAALAKTLSAPPPVLEAMKAAAPAAGAPVPVPDTVTGRVMESPSSPLQSVERRAHDFLLFASIGAMVLLFGGGWVSAGAGKS
jgi:hypothetical protein